MARSSVKREFFIPKDADVIEDKESGAIAYLYTAKPGQPAAMGFGGKRQCPDFHHTFRSGQQQLMEIVA